MHFSDFDPDDFLAKHWQRKALVLRAALAPEFFSLTPEELAGLACEDEADGIESRIITNSDNDWRLHQGPFNADFFQTLGNSHWTLLVQRVDQLLPELAALQECVDFIPGWRFEDIMVSYATRGGDVGPHFDRYDVFLVQGRGQRRWQIGQACDENTPLRDSCELSLLNTFECTEEWTLSPGDVLYLPPGLAHWGTALDNDCMTYSIGFRSPSYHDILQRCCDLLAERLNNDQRYTDNALQQTQEGINAISQQTSSDIRQHLLSLLDHSIVTDAFGSLVTSNHGPTDGDTFSLEERLQSIDKRERSHLSTANAQSLSKNPQCRIAYQIDDASDEGTLFVNGECCALHKTQYALARYLADNNHYSADLLSTLTQHSAAHQLLQLAFDELWIELN